MQLSLDGRKQGQRTAQFKRDDLSELRLERLKAKGDFIFTDFTLSTDSLQVESPLLKLGIELPTAFKAKGFKPLLSASINSPNIAATLTDLGHVQLQDAQIDAKVSNPLDEFTPLSAFATLKLHHLTVEMDNISASISDLISTVSYIPVLLEMNL